MLCPLKIYSKDLKLDAVTAAVFEVQTSLFSDTMWQMRPTTPSISLKSSCSSTQEHLPFPAPSQERQTFVTLHFCVLSSAAIISAGGRPQFLCFLAVLACWTLKLLPYPFFCQPLSTLYLDLSYNSPLLLFFYLQHNHIKTVFVSLKFVWNCSLLTHSFHFIFMRVTLSSYSSTHPLPSSLNLKHSWRLLKCLSI